jgi:hypothetical protein
MKKWPKFKLNPGELLALRPIVAVTGDGRQAYLWIGNENRSCYATLDGAAALRRLVKAINKAVGKKKRRNPYVVAAKKEKSMNIVQPFHVVPALNKRPDSFASACHVGGGEGATR